MTTFKVIKGFVEESVSVFRPTYGLDLAVNHILDHLEGKCSKDNQENASRTSVLRSICRYSFEAAYSPTSTNKVRQPEK